MKPIFYHLLILDASGSMSCIRQQALNGCNETIQSVRSLQTKDECCHYLSLVTFNSNNRTNTLVDAQPIQQVSDLPAAAYEPLGCTPLYDCVGLSVCHLMDRIKSDPQATVLVTIITDGQENSSSLFSAEKVKNLIEECKHSGWTFAFIGANQDEVFEAQKMGIHNTLSFRQDIEGTEKMFWQMEEAQELFCCSKMADREADLSSSLFTKTKPTPPKDK